MYDTRGELDDHCTSYVQPTVIVCPAEEYLYSEERGDALKSRLSHLDALKTLGDPVPRNRIPAQIHRGPRETLNFYMGQATSTDNKYSQTDAANNQSEVENVDPVMTSAEITMRRLISRCRL